MNRQADILADACFAERSQAFIEHFKVITREQRDEVLIYSGPSEAQYRERIAAEASEEAAMLWGLGWKPRYRFARRARQYVRRTIAAEIIGTGSVAERSL